MLIKVWDKATEMINTAINNDTLTPPRIPDDETNGDNDSRIKAMLLT